jgi:hypothetical protein
LEMVKASKWCTSSEKIFVSFLFYVVGHECIACNNKNL